jgi:hypothetical protein
VDGLLEMHDLVQTVGRRLITEAAATVGGQTNSLAGRSRLWMPDAELLASTQVVTCIRRLCCQMHFEQFHV